MSDEPDRITRLETIVAALTANVDKLETSVHVLVTNQGRPNWTALGVMLSGLAMMGAMCAALVFGPVQANERSVQRIETALWKEIDSERDRNNDIERRLSKAEAIDELFKAGKLNLGGTQ